MAARSTARLGRSMSRTVLSALRRPCTISDVASWNSSALQTHSFPQSGSRTLGTSSENPQPSCISRDALQSSRALATSTSLAIDEVGKSDVEGKASPVPCPDHHQQQEGEGASLSEEATKDGEGGDGDELDINEQTGEIGGPKGQSHALRRLGERRPMP